MSSLFEVITCDPPWGFSDNLKAMKRRTTRRSAAANYAVMTPVQIAAIPVADVVNPSGCLLALWVPGSMLQCGLDVMKAWGFSHKQTFVWIKLQKQFRKKVDWNESTRVGLGRLFRQSHEIALIGTSGKSIYPLLQDRSQRSVAFDLNVGHSIKPPTLQDRLDLMFPTANRLEMFARRARPDWTCIGDAIDGVDIVAAINGLSTNVVLQPPVLEPLPTLEPERGECDVGI